MFTDHVEHSLLAGADALLMPSQYEPCGSRSMRAQHYGGRSRRPRVGGLTDSITDGVTGSCSTSTRGGLEQAMGRAVESYGDRTVWRKLVRAAMAPFG